MTPQAAAKGAQGKLKRVNPALVADGVWGSKTQRTFDNAPVALKTDVSDAIIAAGYRVQDLGALTSVQRQRVWIPEQEVRELAVTAGEETGLSPTLIFDFVVLEAAQRGPRNAREFDAGSVAPSGLFHGLMQMGAPAWTDVRRAHPSTPAFNVGRYIPADNILAGARYAALNRAALQRAKFTGEFNLQVAYAAHNQGAAGFMALLRNKKVTPNFLNQSKSAQMVIRMATAQSGVVLA